MRVTLAVVVAAGCRFQSGEVGTTPDAATDSRHDAASDAIPAGWWNPQWTRRSVVDVDTAALTAPLIAFPVLVELTPATFDYGAATTTGADLRFISSDGTTSLAYDLDEFHPDGTSIVWVSLDLSAGLPDTTFWLYYGNSSASPGAAASAVWANYVSVHHLADLGDSSGNGHDGSQANTAQVTARTDGTIGSGQAFTEGSGVESAIELADLTGSAYDLTSGLTVSVWLKTSGAFTEDWQAFVTKGDLTWRLERDSNGGDTGDGPVFGTGDGGNNDNLANNAVIVDDAQWHQIVGVLDPVNGKSLYFDGDAAITDPDTTIETSTDPVWIGDNATAGDTGRSFQGTIDEVRITSELRGSAWIDFEFTMISQAMTASSLVTVQQAQSIAPAP